MAETQLSEMPLDLEACCFKIIVALTLCLVRFHVSDGFFGGNLYIANNERLIQPDAMFDCESLGATLASILSDEENSFIQTLTSVEYSNCGTG